MKTRALVLAGWSFAAVIWAGCGRQSAPPSFEGTWRTTHPTRGITAARIFNESGVWRVQLWGACQPTDCDLGRVRFFQLPDADAKQPDRGFASWADERVTTFRIEGADLVVELYQTLDRQAPNQVGRYFGVVRLAREG